MFLGLNDATFNFKLLAVSERLFVTLITPEGSVKTGVSLPYLSL